MDLIDRGRAVELVRITADEWLADIQDGSYKAGFSLGTHIAMQTMVRDVPSAEKTGRWIEHEDDWFGDYYECSVCGAAFTLIDGTPADNLYNYCPNCGARMGEKE